MPLELKIKYTERRIREWYKYYNGNVHVSFSGGKDSTVLLHIARRIFPNIKAIFSDTGLEYPEIRSFVKSIDNVIWIRPRKQFSQVIKEYGYPIISKEVAGKIHCFRKTNSLRVKRRILYGNEKGHGKIPEKWKFLIDSPFKISDKCCYWLKLSPLAYLERLYGSRPIVGTMADESSRRHMNYLRFGCNNFSRNGASTPMSFWLQDDVWEYIIENNLPHSKIYNMGYERTGCMFCMFGIHADGEKNRFQRMKETHPKQYEYCIYKLGCGKVLDYIGIDYK